MGCTSSKLDAAKQAVRGSASKDTTSSETTPNVPRGTSARMASPGEDNSRVSRRRSFAETDCN